MNKTSSALRASVGWLPDSTSFSESSGNSAPTSEVCKYPPTNDKRNSVAETESISPLDARNVSPITRLTTSDRPFQLSTEARAASSGDMFFYLVHTQLCGKESA